MMSAPGPLLCHRCGTSLATLSLPFARLDECPSCRAELHVCRMCIHFAPRVPKGCDEEDAPDVRDKLRANFCDYFKPSAAAYTGAEAGREAEAKQRLKELFGGTATGTTRAGAPVQGAEPSPAAETAQDEAARRAAEALFRK